MLKTKLTQPKNITLASSIERVLGKVAKILPSIISSPIKLINLILRPLNLLIEIVLFIILIIQTVHVLSGKQKRYLNIRHLLIKWILFLLILLLAEHINKHTIFDQVFILLCNTLAAAMVYPSNVLFYQRKVIKNLHLKYFSYSQKKKFDESIDDPSTFEITLTSRILVSLATFFLSISRLIITFIPLQNRKKVEESIKEVNMTIVEEKYFGKIYDSNWRKGYENQVIGQNLQESINSSKNSKEKQDRRSADTVPKGRGETTIRAKVDEYIQINLGLIVPSEQGHRKFTFYRNIQICYNAETSQLTITNQQDFRSSTVSLSQIVIIDDLMIQLISEEDQESIFVRFKTKSEKQLFINSVYLQS